MRVEGVVGIEAARLARRRDSRPQRRDPDGVDAVRAPLRDRAVGRRAARHQDPVVGDPDLAGPRVSGRRGREDEQGEERKKASHRLLNAAQRSELRTADIVRTPRTWSSTPTARRGAA
jgi:hypothetical protein